MTTEKTRNRYIIESYSDIPFEIKAYIVYLTDFLILESRGSRFCGKIEHIMNNLYFYDDKKNLKRLNRYLIFPNDLWGSEFDSQFNKTIPALITWILDFWERGLNVLEFVYITKKYFKDYINSFEDEFIITHEYENEEVNSLSEIVSFFNEKNIIENLKAAEFLLKIKKNSLLNDWKHLKSTYK